MKNELLAATIALLAVGLGDARKWRGGGEKALAIPQNLARDPASTMTTLELIRSWGYPAEEYKAVTEDGYILTLHRIPTGKTNQSGDRPVVFLQHGLEDSSVSWVINRPEQSFGFLLADEGYDVWMGNMRGSVYSREHVKFDPKSQEFWGFTFDQMVKYDLDALINKALAVSNRSSLHYVGHSQGTLTMFCKLARDTSIHDKIERFFALAPVSHVVSIRGAFSVIAHYLWPEMKLYYYWYGDAEFLPSAALLGRITDYICGGERGGTFCDNIMMLIMGTDSNQLNVTRTPVYMSHIPAGTSTMNVMHWIQMVRSGKLQQYDFGERTNKLRYGQTTPPLYELNKDVNTKIHLYWSPSDWLADEKDISTYLLKELPTASIVEQKKLLDYNHVDFIWGLKAAHDIYQPIIEQINKDYA